MKKKTKIRGSHGGRRNGSGRKPKFDEATTVVSARVPLRTLDAIDKVAESVGISRTDAILQAIEKYLCPLPRPNSDKPNGRRPHT